MVIVIFYARNTRVEYNQSHIILESRDTRVIYRDSVIMGPAAIYQILNKLFFNGTAAAEGPFLHTRANNDFLVDPDLSWILVFNESLFCIVPVICDPSRSFQMNRARIRPSGAFNCTNHAHKLISPH